MSQRETELDTVARLIWLERQKNLDAIERGVAAALPRRDSQLWGYGVQAISLPQKR
jgi:hypothetical protein